MATNRKLAALGVGLVVAACGQPPIGPEDGGGGGADAGPQGPCDETPVTCREEATQALRLGSVVNPGDILNDHDGSSFTSWVDGTRSGGGGGGGLRFSYVYARFDEFDGLQKVELLDDDAFDDLGWDIAFRRAGIRLNGGDSGPSCVTATRAPPELRFDEIFTADLVSDQAQWRMDDFLSPICTYIPDGSGLDQPSTVLSGYFSITQCLEMRGFTYFIRLRNGRTVKLRVDSVYSEGDQAACEAGDPVSFRAHGRFTLRWSFVD